MVAQVDMVNEALQKLGTRTTVTAAQLAANTGSNEAIQANIIYDRTRKRLLRMAPWSCAFNTANLTYISSVPGTPENTSPATTLWQKGQPAPPWAYEYQYPVDCLFAAWLTPNTATGYAGGVPITTAVTGGAPSFWQGPPVKFKVAVDQFLNLTLPSLASPGINYVFGDVITLAVGANTSAPIGAPAMVQVSTTDGSGSILTYAVLTQVPNANPPVAGSYFPAQQFSILGSQGSVINRYGGPSSGTGAVFNLSALGIQDQRVILTNQEFAVLNYVRDVTDPNVFDDLFTNAFTSILGASLNMALAGDKKLSNMLIALANDDLGKARGRDGNEGLTVNDVIPDWLRVRGISYIEDYSGPFDSGYNWGGIWPGYT